MSKKTEQKPIEVLTTDAKGLAERYCISASTARKIGRAANATIKLERRVLYLVSRTDAYIMAHIVSNETERDSVAP